MKEKIYTIPITEIFEKESFCPFCDLYHRLETDAVKYAVGPAMMEPDFRAITNKKGFCRKHIADVESESKALALSLVLQTHLEALDTILQREIPETGKKLFKKEENTALSQLVNEMEEVADSCTVCDRISADFDRYVNTFFHLIATEESFRKIVAGGKGFCFEHFSMLLSRGKEQLRPTAYEAFARQLIANQKEKLSEHHQNILAFIEQFDYRNAGKPAQAPRDTVYQACQLLNGSFERKAKKLDDI